MKKIIFCTLLMVSGFAATAQTARVQVIHNSADAAAEVVDVYVNGDILLNDFEFRTASPFIDAPAGVPLTIVVAPGNSTSAADGIFTTTTTLASNGKYVVVANGIVSATGYAPNQPFNLFVYDMAREMASMGTNTDILVFHGATDAPTVDAVEPGVGIAVNDISYGEFEGYLELETADYLLDVTTADNSTVVESYSVPLSMLDLGGQAITVLASGFLDPAMNSNGPGFGMWVALPTGGDLVQLPLADSMARVQVIHNAADALAQTVDVYLNGDMLIDNFEFRTASPFIDAPAGTPVTIGIAPGNSTSVNDALFTTTTTLDAASTYIIVANGIVVSNGYTPNVPFNLYVYDMGREAASMGGNTDIVVFHGSTDAPTVDVQAQGAGTVVDNISYGEFEGYLELPTDDYIISVATEDGGTIVQTYSAPLQTLGLEGQALTVLASGFLDPSMNSNGPAFGLWVAPAAGGELVELPLGQLSTSNFNQQSLSVYPNPSDSVVNISLPDGFTSLKTTLYDVSGRNVLSAEGKTVIDISGLNSGMYMMEIAVDGNIIKEKIIKR